MDRQREFVRSNAFVDDELDRNDRGEVLDAAADDPRLAKELSDLNRLKSVLEDSVDVPEIELPDIQVRQNKIFRGALAPALAAGFALFAVLGIGLWFTTLSTPSHGVPVAWAIETHKSWRDSATRAGALLRPVRPANVRLNAHVPDLSPAKLRIAHIGEATTLGGLPALVVGYLGTRGCRITLLVDPAPEGLGKKAIKFEVGRLHGVVWRAGKLRHVILAEGMAPGRFKLMAETVRKSSLERLPLDDATRIALAKSRTVSPPCAA
jgi:anti-sigma factor RsiW